jgi:hypothetical protein
MHSAWIFFIKTMIDQTDKRFQEIIAPYVLKMQRYLEIDGQTAGKLVQFNGIEDI